MTRHADNAVPVLINATLFVVVAVIVWNRILSRLFEKAINKIIREKKDCIKNVSYLLGPFSSVGHSISESIEYIKPPRFECNWKIYQRLGFILVALILCLAFALSMASDSTRNNLGILFVFAILAYGIDLLFLSWVVIPYEMIHFTEVVHEVTRPTQI